MTSERLDAWIEPDRQALCSCEGESANRENARDHVSHAISASPTPLEFRKQLPRRCMSPPPPPSPPTPSTHGSTLEVVGCHLLSSSFDRCGRLCLTNSAFRHTHQTTRQCALARGHLMAGIRPQRQSVEGDGIRGHFGDQETSLWHPEVVFRERLTCVDSECTDRVLGRNNEHGALGCETMNKTESRRVRCLQPARVGKIRRRRLRVERGMIPHDYRAGFLFIPSILLPPLTSRHGQQ